MQKVPIYLDQLLFSFEDDSPDNSYYLDLKTGEVRLVHRELDDLKELTDEIEKDRERFLFIPRPDQKKRKDDLRDFIDTIDDDKVKLLLDVAMESPHPKSGFKKILKDKNLDDKLDTFLAARSLVRVKQWLMANCIEI
jgi:hypothetical protein